MRRGSALTTQKCTFTGWEFSAMKETAKTTPTSTEMVRINRRRLIAARSDSEAPRDTSVTLRAYPALG